jgi:hypothetical protein
MKKTTLTTIIGTVIGALPLITLASPGPPTPPTDLPEPSTIFAGALLLVPIGVGAVRALRKLRR